MNSFLHSSPEELLLSASSVREVLPLERKQPVKQSLYYTFCHFTPKLLVSILVNVVKFASMV